MRRRSGRSGRCGRDAHVQTQPHRRRRARLERRGEVDPERGAAAAIAPAVPPDSTSTRASGRVQPLGPFAHTRSHTRSSGAGPRVDEGDVLRAGQRPAPGVERQREVVAGAVRPARLGGLRAVRDEQRSDRRREQRQQAHGSALAALRGEGDEHAAVVVVRREHVAQDRLVAARRGVTQPTGLLHLPHAPLERDADRVGLAVEARPSASAGARPSTSCSR